MTLIHLFIHYFFDDCDLCLFTLFKSRANVTFARFSHTHLCFSKQADTVPIHAKLSEPMTCLFIHPCICNVAV